METKISRKMLAVRESWSEEERQIRKDLAGAMQLQLQTLVVLAELSAADQQAERTVAMASAC